MRLLTRALMVVVTLGLGTVTWSGGPVPGPLAPCGIAPAEAAGRSGCCHYNKGVCGCEDGKPRCCDGKLSASCRCGSGAPVTRHTASTPCFRRAAVTSTLISMFFRARMRAGWNNTMSRSSNR